MRTGDDLQYSGNQIPGMEMRTASPICRPHRPAGSSAPGVVVVVVGGGYSELRGPPRQERPGAVRGPKVSLRAGPTPGGHSGMVRGSSRSGAQRSAVTKAEASLPPIIISMGYRGALVNSGALSS